MAEDLDGLCTESLEGSGRVQAGEIDRPTQGGPFSPNVLHGLEARFESGYLDRDVAARPYLGNRASYSHPPKACEPAVDPIGETRHIDGDDDEHAVPGMSPTLRETQESQILSKSSNSPLSEAQNTREFFPGAVCARNELNVHDHAHSVLVTRSCEETLQNAIELNAQSDEIEHSSKSAIFSQTDSVEV